MSDQFVWVIKEHEISEDAVMQVTAVGRNILLVKREGKVYALGSRCPHAGCELTRASLRENILTCPCHGWSFDVRNGEYQANKHIKLATYECKVENGEVYVKPFDDFF
jgi:nitrite reductase/ring-hydroxylating ferredoxin subunit